MHRPAPSLPCVGVWLLLVAVLPATAGVRINEIHYRPKNESTAEEFIELWNHGKKTVSLEGWRLDRGVDFSFTNQALQPDTGLVIAANPTRLAEQHPNLKNIAGPWDGRLGNNGELIRLVDASGKTVDKIQYATEGDWSRRVRGPLQEGHRGWVWLSGHDAGGRSLELRQPDLPSGHGQNWAASQTDGGTPGRKNSGHTDDLPPMILEAAHSPSLPTSTDGVTVSVSIVDEKTRDVKAQLHFRNDGAEKFGTVPMKRKNQGLFKAAIPPRTDGTVVEFFITAVDSGKNKRTWPNGGPDCPRALYQVTDDRPDPRRPVHRIILKAKERAELAAIGSRQWYRTSDAQMNGTFINREGGKISVRYNVGVRLRGTTSRAAAHKSRRVNFPNDQPWQNRTAINLNAISPHVQELGSALFRMAGLPAPRARAVRVLENNQPLGGPSQFHHYAELDPLNSEYIDWQFPGDANGNLYKGGGHADLKFLGDTAAPYAELHFYAKQTNRWLNDYTDLIDFLRALGQTDGSTLPEALPQQMNLDNWTRHLAVHDLLGNEETSLVTGDRGDYALYAGITDPRFVLIPYDLDGVLGVAGGEKSPVLRATANTALGQALQQPEVATRYWRHLEELAHTVFKPEHFSRTVDRLTGDYLPAAERDRIKAFAARRRAFVLSQAPDSLTVDTRLAKRNGWHVSDSPEVELTGTANATNTMAVRVDGQAATLAGPIAKWQAKVSLRPGLNQILIQSLDDRGEELERQLVPIWHGAIPTKLVSGSLERNTVWTAEKPILISAPMQITEDTTLTIEAGATVCFAPGAHLQVAGRLIANGEPEKRIQLTGLPGETRPWGGIRLNDATETSRLAHVDFHRTGSYALELTNSAMALDHVRWHQTQTNLIWFRDASLTVRDSIFPALEHSEHVRGVGIREGGELVFERCQFGRTTGGNDVMDISGGKRPGPILELYYNVFLGGNDDGLDLDGMDAHIEGNTFSGFNNADRPGYFSAAIATGKPKPEAGTWLNVHVTGAGNTAKSYRARMDGRSRFTDPNLEQSFDANSLEVDGIEDLLMPKYRSSFAKNARVIVKTDESNITVVRNVFHTNDHHILLKENARLTAENNTLVGSRFGAIAFDEPKHDVEMPKGARLVGNIFHDNPVDLIHLNPLWLEKRWMWLHVFDSIIRRTHDWHGDRNVESDPLFTNSPEDVSLRHDSPATGSGFNGLDMGARVPGGASISGEPSALTRSTSATLIIGGSGITHYRYSVNNGPLSSEHPVNKPIHLAKLDPGEYTVQVNGKNSAGRWKSPGQATQSKRWKVDPSLSRVLINELLAWPSGNGRDRIELFNDSAAPTRLGGFSLSDDPAKPRRFVFPENTVIEADGYLVMDGGKNGGLNFKLDNDGESLWLYNAEGQMIDSVMFGRQVDGLSIGRAGREANWTLTHPTFGRENQSVPLGQSQDVRIAGWTANPADGQGDRVILQNTGARPVHLADLRLTNQPTGRPLAFTFPALSFIASGERLEMDSNWIGFKLAASQGELALGKPDGSWIDRHVYGPQPDGRAVILIPPPASPVDQFGLSFEIADGEMLVTWESGDGLIFRVLSSRDLSTKPWHEEAVLDTPPGRTLQFRTKLDGAMKFFQVEQIE